MFVFASFHERLFRSHFAIFLCLVRQNTQRTNEFQSVSFRCDKNGFKDFDFDYAPLRLTLKTKRGHFLKTENSCFNVGKEKLINSL